MWTSSCLVVVFVSTKKISRRTFVKATGAAGVFVVIGVTGSPLEGCGPPSPPQQDSSKTQESTADAPLSESKKEALSQESSVLTEATADAGIERSTAEPSPELPPTSNTELIPDRTPEPAPDLAKEAKQEPQPEVRQEAKPETRQETSFETQAELSSEPVIESQPQDGPRVFMVSLAKHPELQKTGGTKRFNIDMDPVLLMRINSNTFRALSQDCPHRHCTVRWQGGLKTFYCPCHSSEFDEFGKVQVGPARKDLTRYKLKYLPSPQEVHIYY